MNRKKCVLILPRSVFPTVSGYALKNKNVIELLHSSYDLTLVVIKETPFTEEESTFYKQHSNTSLLWVRSKFQCFSGTLLAFLKGQPLQVGYYYDHALQRQIKPYLESCDVAVAVLERTIQYLKDCSTKTIRVFDIVDSIALNYERSKKHTVSRFWKCVYSIEGKRLMKFESHWIQQTNLTYFINQDECEHWKSHGNVYWLPHGVKPELLHYTQKDASYGHSVAFIGKMDYQPNIDAVVWYIKHVHSVIGHNIPLVIVGASPASELIQLASHYSNITITGFVEDPYLILNSAMALIAPMQTGGGIQNKVLEGMALGKINVITSLAAHPIAGAENGKHFLVVNTPEQYIQILQDIKKDPEYYAAIGANARQHILDHFTWEAYNRIYIEKINAALSQV